MITIYALFCSQKLPFIALITFRNFGVFFVALLAACSGLFLLLYSIWNIWLQIIKKWYIWKNFQNQKSTEWVFFAKFCSIFDFDHFFEKWLLHHLCQNNFKKNLALLSTQLCPQASKSCLTSTGIFFLSLWLARVNSEYYPKLYYFNTFKVLQRKS